MNHKPFSGFIHVHLLLKVLASECAWLRSAGSAAAAAGAGSAAWLCKERTEKVVRLLGDEMSPKQGLRLQLKRNCSSPGYVSFWAPGLLGELGSQGQLGQSSGCGGSGAADGGALQEGLESASRTQTLSGAKCCSIVLSGETAQLYSHVAASRPCVGRSSMTEVASRTPPSIASSSGSTSAEVSSGRSLSPALHCEHESLATVPP